MRTNRDHRLSGSVNVAARLLRFERVILARCDHCGRRDPELAKWLPPRAFFRGIAVGALLVAAFISIAHAIYFG